MTSLGLLDSLKFFTPEIILVVLALLLVALDCIPSKTIKHILGPLTLVGFIATGAFAAWQWFGLQSEDLTQSPTKLLFSGTVVFNSFTLFLKVLFCAVATVITFISLPLAKEKKFGEGEYYGLLVCAVFGMFILSSSVDLLLMWIALEMVSIPSYIVTGFLQGNRKSKEASLKYVIYGSVAAGTMVYGISLLYGATGTTKLIEMADYLAAARPTMDAAFEQGMMIGDVAVVSPVMLFAGFIMVLFGLGYKIAAVPFHSWCPDAYEGAPTPFTAFMSVGPKAAGFGALTLFLYLGLSQAGSDGTFSIAFNFESMNGLDIQKISLEWPLLIGFVSICTMTIGNLGALGQTNLKRLFAYSSIAHAGYMLMGLVVLNTAGIAAVLLYLAIYMFMNLGAFIGVITLEERYGVTDIAGCKGMGWKVPALGVAMTIFLFSLTGIPPLAGFIGKFAIFKELIASGNTAWLVLALIGALNGVISLVYYAKVLKSMFLQKPDDMESEVPPMPVYLAAAMLLMAIPTLVLGVFFGPLADVAKKSLVGFLQQSGM